MPLYTGDYLRDTQHLSLREHGCYLMMLMWCWQRAKPMPNDMLRICRIARCKDEIDDAAAKYVLEEFFTLGDDNCYHNKRLENELTRSESYSIRATRAANVCWNNAKPMLNKCLTDANGDAKSMPESCTPSPSPQSTYNANALLRTNSDANLLKADAIDLNTHPSTQNLVGENEKKKSKALSRATRMTDIWALPSEWGNWALQERPELTRENVKNIANEFHDHFLGTGGSKANWLATWRNWVRREKRLTNKPLSVGDHNKRALDEWKTQRREKLINEENENE